MGIHHGFRPQGNNSYTPADPFFRQTVLLLHGDGANGANNNVFIGSNFAPDGLPGGSGAFFDGAGDYLTLAHSTAYPTGTQTFTMEAWFYTRALSINQCIMSKTSVNAINFGIYINTSNQLIFTTQTGGSLTGPTVTSDRWYHIAITGVSGTVRMWLDGVQVTSGSVTLGSTTNPFYIGALDPGNAAFTWPFNGYISNVRIVNGTALYTANFTVPTAPLTAVTNTQLLTCHTTSFIDGSTNNFAITVNGDTSIVSTRLPITRNGNTTQGTFTPFSVADGNWSNYFDGGASYLSTPSTALFGSGDYTVEAWVYYNAVPTNFTAILNGLSTGSLSFYYDGGRFLTNFLVVSNRSVNQLTHSWTPAINTWYHLAVSRSNSTVRLFINGSQVASTTDSTNYSTAAVYNIGYDSGVASGGTNGYISNLRAVNGTALYTTNFTVPTAPLTAITNTSLLTCQSNRFRDTSTNNHTLTRNGNVTVRPFSPFAPSAAYSASTNGGSGYFDGTGDFLNFTGITFNGDFCAECWFYKTANPTNYSVIFGGSPSVGNNNHQFYVGNDGSVIMVLAGVAILGPAGTAAALNQWNHIAWVRQGSNCAIFVNGVRQGTGTSSNNTSICSRIGDIAGLAGYSPIGYISNARIVIGSSVYNPTVTTITVPTAPLTAIANTSLLLSFTNGGIIDNTGDNVIETVGDAQANTSVVRFGSGSIRFDGTGDYLVVPSSVDTQLGSGNWTFECWVYFNTLPANCFIYDQRSADNQVVPCIYLNTSSIVFFVNGADRITGTGLVTGRWYHFALAKSGSTTKMFIDGIQAGSDYTDTNNYIANIAYIGSRYNATLQLNGFIDDLRITKGVARYTSNFNPNYLTTIPFYTGSPFFDR